MTSLLIFGREETKEVEQKSWFSTFQGKACARRFTHTHTVWVTQLAPKTAIVSTWLWLPIAIPYRQNTVLATSRTRLHSCASKVQRTCERSKWSGASNSGAAGTDHYNLPIVILVMSGRCECLTKPSDRRRKFRRQWHDEQQRDEGVALQEAHPVVVRARMGFLLRFPAPSCGLSLMILQCLWTVLESI